MVRHLSVRGNPCRPVLRPRRPRRSIVRAAHTQSTDAASDSPEKGADLFTELKKISEQQKEIEQREEQQERWESPSSGRSKIESPTESLSYVDIDESSPHRGSYHSQLFLAAKNGDVISAEEIIRQMVADGFEPGPRAYHALVFANVKAGTAHGALTAIRRAHSSGARPLTESYVVLIYAFMLENNVKNAEAVFSSMLRPNANANPEKGWLMLATMFFREGFESKALECLEDGRRESFTPDRALFALVIRHYCKKLDYESALEELSELVALQKEATEDLFCEIRHVKDLLEHFAEQGDVPMLMWLKSLPESLDLQCYNAILHGIVNSWDDKTIDAENLFEDVWSALRAEKDFKRSPESFLLLAEAELKKGDALAAQKVFVDNQLAEVRKRRQHDLMYRLLTPLLQGLSDTGNPIAINDLLVVMRIGSTCAPDEALIPDEHGRTFITQWLVRRVQEETAVGDDSRPEIVFTSDGRQARLINGVKIGFANCLVNDDGTVVPMSKLRVFELRAECEARGLKVEGSRRDLYQALSKARRANPAIADELKRAQKLAREKRAVENAKRKKKMDAAAAKKLQSSGEGTYIRKEYVNGRLVSEKEVSAEEAESQFMSAEALLPATVEDDEDTVEIRKPGQKHKIKKWTDIYSLRSRQYSDLGSNQTAGIDAAVTISESVWKIGSFPTLEDFEIMVEINKERKSPVAAWKLGLLIQKRQAEFKPTDVTAERPADEYGVRAYKIVQECCLVCLAAGFPDACEQIIYILMANGGSVDPVLLQELQVCRARMQGASPEEEEAAEEEETEEEESESAETASDSPVPVHSNLMSDDEGDEMEAEIEEDVPIPPSEDEESYAGFSRSAIERLHLSEEIDDEELDQPDADDMAETNIEL